jgi:hypothetical protein
MARSSLLQNLIDLQSDSGSILWSMVQGEQLELPVVLNFIEVVSSDYQYEAVIIEANNVDDGAVPTEAKIDGVINKLMVRVPLYRGLYSSTINYNKEDVVKYTDGKYYKKVISSPLPGDTPDTAYWIEHLPNTVYIQFTDTLSVNPAWTPQPTITSAVYGFFELRVTEPIDVSFRRTWKPVRGLVSLNYSPTARVAD